MGLFCFFKKKQSSSLINTWLYEADDMYANACEIKNPRGLDKYFIGKAMDYILQVLNSSNRVYQGLDKYRHTTFKLLKSKGGIATYLKTVTYDNVKLSRGIKVAVGDNYEETWSVSKVNGRVYIQTIERL